MARDIARFYNLPGVWRTSLAHRGQTPGVAVTPAQPHARHLERPGTAGAARGSVPEDGAETAADRTSEAAQ